jgi:TolA-binding protein
MSERDCRSELLVRAERGQLSHAERLALDAHLAACASCRLARDVFGAFSPLNTIEPQDGARIERLAAVARGYARRKQRPLWRARSAPRVRVLLIAAALALLAGTASAGSWWWKRRPAVTAQAILTPRPGLTATAALSKPNEPTASMTPPAAPPSEGAPVAVDLPSPALATDPASDSTQKRVASRGPTASDASSAALLRQAGDAERRGDTTDALTLYRKLEQLFPASSEASLAAVPLARLLLARGSTSDALREFDRYLNSSRGGALVPEALYGRARTLAALGDRDEERRTWQRLLADFPSSAYAPIGRQRLAVLHP